MKPKTLHAKYQYQPAEPVYLDYDGVRIRLDPKISVFYGFFKWAGLEQQFLAEFAPYLKTLANQRKAEIEKWQKRIEKKSGITSPDNATVSPVRAH